MFNPSSCQELVKLICCQGHPVSPSGTNDRLMGDKRESRGGQTSTPSGTNENIVGD